MFDDSHIFALFNVNSTRPLFEEKRSRYMQQEISGAALLGNCSEKYAPESGSLTSAQWFHQDIHPAVAFVISM
jgi:hypothetical protein